jgi:hypothetical protein
MIWIWILAFSESRINSEQLDHWQYHACISISIFFMKIWNKFNFVLNTLWTNGDFLAHFDCYDQLTFEIILAATKLFIVMPRNYILKQTLFLRQNTRMTKPTLAMKKQRWKKKDKVPLPWFLISCNNTNYYKYIYGTEHPFILQPRWLPIVKDICPILIVD